MVQIRSSQNPDLHLWALAQLCDSNSIIRNYINSISVQAAGTSLPLRPFCGERSYEELIRELALATQSPNLLLAAVLSVPAEARKELLIRYRSRASTASGSTTMATETLDLIDIIIRGEAITSEVLPYDSFEFSHFLLFYQSELFRNGILTSEYLNDASSLWQALGIKFQNQKLKQSLFTASLFRAFYLTDEYIKTEALYNVLIQDDTFPVSNSLLSLHRALDYSMYRLGFYDRSLHISRTLSVPLARYFDDEQKELTSLILQGVYLIEIGKIDEARTINLQVLEKVESNDSLNISKSGLYTNLAVTYVRTGNFDQYLALQFQALEEAKEQENYAHQLDILNNLYIYYRQNNDPNSALLYLEQATELAQRSGEDEDLGIIYTNLGIFYKKFHQNYALSFEYFRKAKAVLDSSNHFDPYQILLFEEGKLYEELGEYDLALQRFNEVIANNREKNIKYLFEALLNKTAIYLDQNKLNEASGLISEITSYDFNQFDFKHIVKAKTVQAKYLVMTGKMNEAYTILKPTIQQTIQWARNSTDLQTGYWNVEQEFLDAFQLMTDVLISEQKFDEAVEVLDQLKSINDAALYQNPMVKSSLLNESELSEYQRITDQLDQLRKQLFASSEGQHPELQSHIDRLSARKRALDRKITSLADREPVRVRRIQSQLSGYEAIVHTTELNNWYYIATILRNDIRFKKVRLDSSLQSTFTRAAEQLAEGHTNLEDLYTISEVLDLQSLPDWISNITVIPDSYLFQLPVDVLPLNQPDTYYSYGDTRYLIERFNISYLTTLHDYLMPPPTNSRPYKWDFVGYGVSNFQGYSHKQLVPLPYAQIEVENIVEGLTNLNDKTTFVDSASTEKTFKATAPHARILHLATHSEVSDRDPLFSSIYLSRHTHTHGASADESGNLTGRIFAYELFGLNLANDLIMLNSCESGSGSYLQGAGIMGFSRALRYAGANSLILNSWSVNDMMASEFANQFYKNLNTGMTKAEALRTAKLYMLKNNNANPHYWGTYVLVGQNNPIIKPAEQTNFYLASSFMVYLVVLIIASMAKGTGFKHWFS
jgi:CHAT domain-containing protein